MSTEGSNTRPGYAFFIVNPLIENAYLPGRSGKSDLDNFETIFARKLGFEWVNKHFNKNITLGMWNHLRDSSYNPGVHRDQCCIICLMKSKDYTDVCSIVLGISTHGGAPGGKQYVKLHGGEQLLVNDIMEDLSDAKFPQLAGKNRILVIDCCRHDRSNPEKARDKGVAFYERVELPEDPSFTSSTQPVTEGPEGAGGGDATFGLEGLNVSSTSEKPTTLIEESDIQRQSGDAVRGSKSQLRDFLVIYATTPGRISFSGSSIGSWMLDSLTEVINNHTSPRLNLLHALTKAAYIMSKKESYNKEPDLDRLKCILCISITLTSLQDFTIQLPEEQPQKVSLFD